jgi:hypothetical protein
MNPIVSAFKSPHFPDIETKRKIKCEWDVTGESNMKYWVKVRQQFLTPNSSDTTNCLYVKGKGTMCAGKVIPVITKKNKLFMKMTIDSAELDPVKGGLEGVYVEQDPSETGGISIARASTVEHPCEDDHQKTCYELSCSSTDSGPDLQLKPVTLTPAQNQSSTKKFVLNTVTKLFLLILTVCYYPSVKIQICLKSFHYQQWLQHQSNPPQKGVFLLYSQVIIF